jgi:hypothetical protein
VVVGDAVAKTRRTEIFLLLFFKKEALPSSKKPKPAPPGRGPARLYTADF